MTKRCRPTNIKRNSLLSQTPDPKSSISEFERYIEYPKVRTGARVTIAWNVWDRTRRVFVQLNTRLSKRTARKPLSLSKANLAIEALSERFTAKDAESRSATRLRKVQ